jgi:tetratricopeptide (TPR) repeat protein
LQEEHFMKQLLTFVALLAAVALLVPAPGAAQSSGGVRGKVVDEEKQPVADAEVLIEFEGGVTRKYEVKTNDKGEYMQVGLPVGPYKITATKEGYVPGAIGIRVGIGIAESMPDVELISNEAAAQQAAPDTELIKEKFDKGVEAARAGRLDEAETIFNELLVEQPGIAEVHRNLGYIHAQREDWAKAEASYQAAIDLRPGDPAFVTALAKLYQDTGQEEKAVALMSQAAAENPEDAQTQLNQGIFQINQGQTAEAQASFEAALAADPSLAEAHYHLGTILVGQGKIPEAVEHLETYLASNPPNEQYAATAQGLVQALKQ